MRRRKILKYIYFKVYCCIYMWSFSENGSSKWCHGASLSSLNKFQTVSIKRKALQGRERSASFRAAFQVPGPVIGKKKLYCYWCSECNLKNNSVRVPSERGRRALQNKDVDLPWGDGHCCTAEKLYGTTQKHQKAGEAPPPLPSLVS